MRKGRRVSSSSESDGSRESDSGDSSGGSSDPEPESDPDPDPESESSSDPDVEAKGGAMKRSQGFSTSFSFAEDDPQQQQQLSEGKDDGGDRKNSNNGVPVVVEEEPQAGESRTSSDGSQPQRSGLFRPQQLWLAVSRCLSLRWPPCLSISRQSNAKLAYRLDRPEDAQSSLSSGSTNQSSSSSSSSVSSSSFVAPTLVKQPEKEAQSKAAVRCSVPAPRRGLSRSTSRLPRARAAADSALASFILERETFLRVELVESGDEREESHYRAEWKLSERSRDLAEGVWLSRSPGLLVD